MFQIIGWRYAQQWMSSNFDLLQSHSTENGLKAHRCRKRQLVLFPVFEEAHTTRQCVVQFTCRGARVVASSEQRQDCSRVAPPNRPGQPLLDRTVAPCGINQALYAWGSTRAFGCRPVRCSRCCGMVCPESVRIFSWEIYITFDWCNQKWQTKHCLVGGSLSSPTGEFEHNHCGSDGSSRSCGWQLRFMTCGFHILIWQYQMVSLWNLHFLFGSVSEGNWKSENNSGQIREFCVGTLCGWKKCPVSFRDFVGTESQRWLRPLCDRTRHHIMQNLCNELV